MSGRIVACLALLAILGGCGGQRGEPAPGSGAAPDPAAQRAEPERTGTPAGDPTPTTEEQTVTTPTGLQYVDLVVGDGPNPAAGQTAVVHYTGWLTNGQKFDSSHDRGTPFSFVVGQRQVIRGWDEGVASMRLGGKRKLIVPPDLAYGEAGAGGVIPANATLIFEVELLEIR